MIDALSVIQENDKWKYFHGCLPIFGHSACDRNSFRMISSAFISSGVCRNIDIQRTFHVSYRSIIRNYPIVPEIDSKGTVKLKPYEAFIVELNK